MHAMLIIGSAQSIDEYIESYFKRSNIIHYDLKLSSIDDSKNLLILTKNLFSKPTTFVLKDVDMATTEALNCILKAIEEPQENISYILTSSSESGVLPTIMSRCRVINTGYSENVEFDKSIIDFIADNTEKRFKKVSLIKKRDEAIDFASQILAYLHHQIKKDPNKSHFDSIDLINQIIFNLKKNANVNLQLTLLAIKLGHVEYR